MTRFLLTIAVLSAGVMPASIASVAAAEYFRPDSYSDALPQRVIARLGTPRLHGCWDPVVFSPDGKYLVTAGGEYGQQALFWDRGTGRQVKALTTSGTILRLVFSPDGKRLAAVKWGIDNSNLLWDVASGKELFTFRGQEVAFRAQGKQLVSITFNGDKKPTVRSYDVDTGKEKSTWTPDYSGIGFGFDLSPDGRFACIRLEGTPSDMVVLDLNKHSEEKKFRCSQGQIPSAFSPDGRLLLVVGSKNLQVWERSSGKVLCSWEGGFVNPPAFSGDGRQLAWTGADSSGISSVWIMDVASGKARPLRKITADKYRQHPPAFSPDGKSVAIVTGGGVAAILDSRTGGLLLPLDCHIDRVEQVAFTPDGRHVVTRDDSTALVWEARTGRLLRRFPDDLPKQETALLSTATHGRIVTTRAGDNTLRVRDLATGKEVRQLKTDGHFLGLKDVAAVTVDGHWAALLGIAGVRIHDLDTGALRCSFSPVGFSPNLPIHLRFSPDGAILEVEIQEEPSPDMVRFVPRYYEAAAGRQVATDKLARGFLSSARSWPATADSLAMLKDRRLLDQNGKLAFERMRGDIHEVHESPGGRYLGATGVRCGDINEGRQGIPWLRLWDCATRRLLLDLDKIAERGERIAGFSADGRTLVSRSQRTNTIRFWEIATGRKRLRLAGHLRGNDVTIGLRPDGRVLVSGGGDAQVFLWDVTGRAPDGVARQARPSPEQMRQLWKTLADDDAAAAYRAIWALVDAPAQTVAWMRQHLPPIAPVESRRLSRLIADLDSDEFSVRSKATEELEHLGELAEPALRGALASRPTLECRRRCEDLLAKLSVLSGERLRAVRAVEVLEHLGTVEARKLLEQYGRGAAGARLTQEARAARKRLAVRPAAP